MAINFHAYPYQGYQTTEAEYSRLLDAIAGGSGLVDPLTHSISGMNINFGAIDAIIRGHRAVAASGGSASLESTTKQRYALIAAKIQYGQTPLVSLVIRYSETATPAVVQTKDGVFEIPLLAVTVPANATTLTSGNVTVIWQRFRAPSPAMIYVQSTRPDNPPVGSIRMW